MSDHAVKHPAAEEIGDRHPSHEGEHHHHVTPPASGVGEHAHRHEPNAGALTEADLRMGRMIYEMSCAFCHGRRGRGDGGAAIFLGPYSHPRPNDFISGAFKFRSTRAGEPPMLEDLMRTIRDGIPGFMPAYRSLGEEGIRRVASYIASEFIRKPLADTTDIVYLDYPGPAARTPASVRRGRTLYDQLGCAGCHGADGRGADVHLQDERGLHIMPMDLTRHGMFGGGGTPEDLYRILMTGMDGTPMPGYADAFSGREAEVWDLVHFLLSLQEP